MQARVSWPCIPQGARCTARTTERLRRMLPARARRIPGRALPLRASRRSRREPRTPGGAPRAHARLRAGNQPIGCRRPGHRRADALSHDGDGRARASPLAVERVPAGSGPRIMAYHPRLPLAAVVDELANDVLVFHIGEAADVWTLLGRWDLLGRTEEDGAPPETEATAPSEAEATAQAAVVGRPTRAGHPTGPAGGASGHDELSPARRTNLAAHGAFAPDGRRLYVSVRGGDLMVVFDLDREGHATRRSAFPSGGRGPRHFSLSPSASCWRWPTRTAEPWPSSGWTAKTRPKKWRAQRCRRPPASSGSLRPETACVRGRCRAARPRAAGPRPGDDVVSGTRPLGSNAFRHPTKPPAPHFRGIVV